MQHLAIVLPVPVSYKLELTAIIIRSRDTVTNVAKRNTATWSAMQNSIIVDQIEADT